MTDQQDPPKRPYTSTRLYGIKIVQRYGDFLVQGSRERNLRVMGFFFVKVTISDKFYTNEFSAQNRYDLLLRESWCTLVRCNISGRTSDSSKTAFTRRN